MNSRVGAIPIVVLPLLLAVTGATAQQFDLQSPVPRGPQDRHKPAPDQPRSRPRTPDADLYPHRSPVPFEPAFIEPLSRTNETGRTGMAGWLSPNTPAGARGAADPDNRGWIGSGLAIEWGGAPKSSLTR